MPEQDDGTSCQLSNVQAAKTEQQSRDEGDVQVDPSRSCTGKRLRRSSASSWSNSNRAAKSAKAPRRLGQGHVSSSIGPYHQDRGAQHSALVRHSVYRKSPSSPNKGDRVTQDSTQAMETQHGSGSSSDPVHYSSASIHVHHVNGDLFTCAPGSVLVHACNCLGSWGAGVAAAFRKKYPRAFRIYADHCRSHASRPSRLVGTALLIPPQTEGKGRECTDWIGCLFTREQYGKAKGKTQRQDVEDILEATGLAWIDLLRQIRKIENERVGGDRAKKVSMGDVVMPKINGGLFKVPWERTEKVLRGVDEWTEGMRTECWFYEGG